MKKGPPSWWLRKHAKTLQDPIYSWLKGRWSDEARAEQARITRDRHRETGP